MNMNLSDSDRWLTWTELRTKAVRRERMWRRLGYVALVLGLVLMVACWLVAVQW